ncbi:MAG: SpoIVB peptidase S55 domain-containing protein [Bacillota bacterium]
MRKLNVLLIGTLICLIFTLPVAAELSITEDTMELDEIQEGMTGIGKTVVSGTEVETFQVEVLGKLDNQGVDSQLLLIEVSGDVIDRTGGIAAGMSGSPIYIDGQLVGAIGYGWQLTEHKIGMVTPIKEMLNIWELDDIEKGETLSLAEPLELGERQITKVQFGGSAANTADDRLVARRVQTPLVVNGLDKQAMDYLDQELKEFDVQPLQSVSNQELLAEEVQLKPGSAVAVELVRGDINVSGLGTLTYLDEDKFLGFGHPFLGRGDSNYFLSSAYIHQMIKSIDMPFKLGSPLNPKGVVTQDRTAGIGGSLDRRPKVIPLEVRVVDQNLGREEKVKAQVIRNEDLIQPLAGSVIYQAINSTIDRRGGGTAEVKMEIMANNLEESIIQRENIFYSRDDVSSVALNDFLQALNLVTHNPFQQIDLINIELDVTVKEEPQVALIKEVNVLTDELRPGEEVELEVKLQPYRQESITKRYSFELPEDIESGEAYLEVIGGREANFTAQTQDQQEEVEYGYGENETFRSLEEVLSAFEKQKINSDLVVNIIPNPQQAVPVSGEQMNRDQAEKRASEREANKQEWLQEQIEEVFETNFLLEGQVDTKIKILADDQKKN